MDIYQGRARTKQLKKTFAKVNSLNHYCMRPFCPLYNLLHYFNKFTTILAQIDDLTYAICFETEKYNVCQII